jgi:hypothetical protein
MEPSNTFFEQIPVETVKRIAKEFSEESPIGGNGDNKQMPDEVRSGRESWREVAEKVQHGQDPKRMTELVEELIAKLDQEKLGKRPPVKRDAGNR